MSSLCSQFAVNPNEKTRRETFQARKVTQHKKPSWVSRGQEGVRVSERGLGGGGRGAFETCFVFNTLVTPGRAQDLEFLGRMRGLRTAAAALVLGLSVVAVCLLVGRRERNLELVSIDTINLAKDSLTEAATR